MNAGQSREVDLDLLAEYVGGALRGTPAEAAVAGLIAANPAWSRAHEAMTEAVDAVCADLAVLSRTPEQMPVAIADRIATALADADVDAGAGRGTVDEPQRLPDLVQRRRSGPPDRYPAGAAGASGRASSRRGVGRRTPRWVPIAVAAAVAAFAGFGANELLRVNRTDRGSTAAYQDASGAGESAGLSSGAPRALAQPPAERLLATGTDYHPATLAETIERRAQKLPQGKAEAAPAAGARADAAGPGLSRLADRAALSACLDAVAAEHARGLVAVDLVDYASFEGSPALILAFTDGGGGRWGWVVGPNCGRAESGADTRYRTSLG